MRTALRVGALGLLLAVFWVTLRWAPVSAQDSRLIELVAKVSFNEARDSYEDLAMLWQITEAHGSNDAERAYWLERHSGCVSGRLTQDQARRRPGNCRWTRNLHSDGRRPRGWDPSQDGLWARTRVAWLAHIRVVRAFVRGLDGFRPCVLNPTTWDGERWQAGAESRGWVPVVCMQSPFGEIVGSHARNVGYVRGAS